MHSLTRQPLIYILHGWAVDEKNELKWLPLMKELRSRGIKTKFLGLPGLTTPLHEVWTLNDYLRWLDQELLGKRDLILLGHSFGGQLAIRFAATHPRQMRKLILVAAAGQRDHSLKAKIKRGVFWSVAKVGKTILKGDRWRKLLYKAAREQDYYQAPPVVRQTMANVITEEVLEDAARIKVPTLLIWGEQDRVTPLSFALNYHRAIATSDLARIPTARHSPHFTHVKDVAKLVKGFVG